MRMFWLGWLSCGVVTFAGMNLVDLLARHRKARKDAHR